MSDQLEVLGTIKLAVDDATVDRAVADVRKKLGDVQVGRAPAGAGAAAARAGGRAAGGGLSGIAGDVADRFGSIGGIGRSMMGRIGSVGSGIRDSLMRAGQGLSMMGGTVGRAGAGIAAIGGPAGIAAVAAIAAAVAVPIATVKIGRMFERSIREKIDALSPFSPAAAAARLNMEFRDRIRGFQIGQALGPSLSAAGSASSDFSDQMARFEITFGRWWLDYKSWWLDGTGKVIKELADLLGLPAVGAGAGAANRPVLDFFQNLQGGIQNRQGPWSQRPFVPPPFEAPDNYRRRRGLPPLPDRKGSS